MSEIIIGDSQELKEESSVKPEGEVCCYLTNIGMILCFIKEIKDGEERWVMPLVLETVSQRNQQTGEITRSQGFRPLIPLTKGTYLVPKTTNFILAARIYDEKLEHAYEMTLREIRAQMAGLVVPKQPSVGENSGIVVGS